MRLIKNLYTKKISGAGLSLFRISYSIVLLCEVSQLYYFRHLIFDKIPFIEPSEVDVTYGLQLWMLTVVLLALGFYTRFVSILNYIFSVVYIAAISSYEYHMFYVYMGVNFLLIFIDTGKVISIDELRRKLTFWSDWDFDNEDRSVPALNYFVILLVAVAFVYLDSVFWKLTSHNWMSGIGMWLPASMVFMVFNDFTFLLNYKWFALFLGYLTFAFEIVFPFTFFRRKWRVPLLIVGMGLHLGITLVFTIPWFGLGVIAIYLLMVPVGYWKKLHQAFSFKKHRLEIFYDSACVVCTRRMIMLGHFDILKALKFSKFDECIRSNKTDVLPNQINIHPIALTRTGLQLEGIDVVLTAFRYSPILFFVGWAGIIPFVRPVIRKFFDRSSGKQDAHGLHHLYKVKSNRVEQTESWFSHKWSLLDFRILMITIGISLILLLQVLASYFSPFIGMIFEKIGFRDTKIDNGIRPVLLKISEKSRTYFGVTNHPVFMDSHFAGYNHVIAVEGVEANGEKHWLPIIDQNGMPDYYNIGFGLVKWTFRVNGTVVNQKNLTLGIRDFTTFWTIKNGMEPDAVSFNLYVKKIEIPDHWEKNVLRRQIESPWIKCGEAKWEKGEFVSDLCNIESM